MSVSVLALSLSRRAFALLLLALLVSCDLAKIHHFRLPAGYRGPFVVVAYATFPQTTTHFSAGRYVHDVPNSGIVCVTSNRMFETGWRLTAEYDDGSPIFSIFQGFPIKVLMTKI